MKVAPVFIATGVAVIGVLFTLAISLLSTAFQERRDLALGKAPRTALGFGSGRQSWSRNRDIDVPRGIAGNHTGQETSLRDVIDSRIPADAFPLRTSGRRILDAKDRQTRLFCVNWYGAEAEEMVVNGLKRQTMDVMVSTIVKLGFNCVRLPFSLDLVFDKAARVPDPEDVLAANPKLRSLTPLEIFDETVSALTGSGLVVILTNHISSSGWCCTATDGQGLWYTKEYPEDKWLEALRTMSARYKTNPHVAGFDIRNEIRPSVLGTPTWGSGTATTDWSIAAAKGGKEVLAANSDMLIFVSALNFGMFLCQLPVQPIHSTVPELRGRTVYEVHDYDWFNFQFMAQSLMEMCLAIWALCTIGLFIWVIWAGNSSSAALPANNAPRPRCFSLRRRAMLSHAVGIKEPLVGLLLALVWLLCLSLNAFTLTYCTSGGFAVFVVAFSLGQICGMLSLVLWMRVALAILQKYIRNRAAVQPAPEPSDPNIEMTAREVKIVDPAASAAEADKDARAGSIVSSESPPSWIRALESDANATPQYVPLLVMFFVSLAVFGLILSLYFELGTYEVYARGLDLRWGFILEAQNGVEAAPVWVGEFGTRKQELWWSHVLRYMKERDVGWAYWSYNGELKWEGKWQEEEFGILEADGLTTRHDWKVRDLQSLMSTHGSQADANPVLVG